MVDNALLQSMKHSDTNMMEDNIDISFIIATRNDEQHGGNPILRLRFTLHQISLYQWKRWHHVNAEIIIVEWNIIKTNPHIWQYPLIQSLLSKIEIDDNISTQIKFYSVHSYFNDIIQCKPLEMYCPFYQYHAKNVGVRRSNGKWKIVMNIDDIFSIKLLQWLGYNLHYSLLDKNGIYLAPIQHISMEHIYHKYYRKAVLDELDLNTNKNIKLLETTPIMHENATSCKASTFSNYSMENIKGFPIPATGDFVLIHNDSLYNYYGGGWLEICNVVHIDSEFVVRMVHINKLIPYQMSADCSYYHVEHSKESKTRTNETINCDQHITQGIYQGMIRNKIIPRNNGLDQIYDKQHEFWGLKSLDFICDKYNTQTITCDKMA